MYHSFINRRILKNRPPPEEPEIDPYKLPLMKSTSEQRQSIHSINGAIGNYFFWLCSVLWFVFSYTDHLFATSHRNRPMFEPVLLTTLTNLSILLCCISRQRVTIVPQRMGAIPENMMGDFIHADIFLLTDNPEDLVIHKKKNTYIFCYLVWQVLFHFIVKIRG